MKMSFFFLLASTFCLFPQARAEEILSIDWYLEDPAGLSQVPPGMSLEKLLTMTNDRDKSIRTFSAMIDKTRSIGGMYIDSSFGKTGNVFFLRDVESARGVVLAEAMGHNAVILQGRLNRATQEGDFRLDYLANALTGEYKRCSFHLQKDGDGWNVQNAYNFRPVSNIHVVSWTLGISTIQGICPDSL